MQPPVPATVDLRDFPYLPIDVQRLLTSETWMLGTGEERAAAMTLWLVSWHQVPAGSLPENERMLAHLSQAKSWSKVKTHVLAGWKRADDGRLYHPVVAEKALEAWLEKLAQRRKSGVGNASRWGADFDPSSLDEEISRTRELLRTLNPQSRVLLKKIAQPIPQGPKSASPKHPSRNPTSIPQGSHQESHSDPSEIAREGKGREVKAKADSSRAVDPHSARDLPPGVDPEAWRLFVQHHTARRRWSASASVLALGELRLVIAEGHDPSAVLRWATTRSLAGLADAARRMAGDEQRAGCDETRQLDGESLADRAARLNRVHDERETPPTNVRRLGHG